jgi:uncharacterized protein (DUF1330 family)
MDIPLTGACIVGRIRIKDPGRWATYLAGVPATIAPFAGELVARGHDAHPLAGAAPETDLVIIRFPTMDAIDGWYASAAYQALIPLREAAAEVTLVAYAL